jgi:hypothetical protein
MEGGDPGIQTLEAGVQCSIGGVGFAGSDPDLLLPHQLDEQVRLSEDPEGANLNPYFARENEMKDPV